MKIVYMGEETLKRYRGGSKMVIIAIREIILRLFVLGKFHENS